MFGGYNPALPFYVEGSQVCFGFNYFSDTFVLDYREPAPRWKQVITGSFPTYRAQGQLLTDPATGRMYLFGGYTNTDWVPTGNQKHDLTRSYGDVWELRVDTPGGLFEEVDWEDERRTAQLGPWQACYSCGSVGVWKRCGGTCTWYWRTQMCLTQSGRLCLPAPFGRAQVPAMVVFSSAPRIARKKAGPSTSGNMRAGAARRRCTIGFPRRLTFC